ncbi:uncharacterized protein [Typha latifolia]|uniref:uncharacterized protein isoform X1 n=1 Tax=Typha latifolia TaxID=4733 RepID=UPI003C2AB0CC
MAAAAFRSTTRKSVRGGADEDAGSSTRSGGGVHRRSRSLSRFPPPAPESDEFPTPRGKFVNKVRGSGSPEISLDDLADEFFRARAESDGEEDGAGGRLPANGRSTRRSSGAGYAMETEASRRRGRSVSRPPPDRRGVTANGVVSNGGAPRRQRYSSVDPHRFINSENNLDVSNGYNPKTTLRRSGMGNFRHTASQKPTNTGYAMRRSMSQKNFFLSQDSYSSHSSLTDDEARDVLSNQNRNERTIQAVYAQEKEHPVGDGEGVELYEVMRKEVRHAVEEIRKELEKVSGKAEPTKVGNNDIQPVKVISELRRNYTSKLEESERRKQELLAELAAEEHRGQELTKIVKDLLPSAQKAAPDRQARSSRRSRDRTRVSKRLTEEAERYFEDFLSNVEDTDLSSFDGERSDASSTRRDAAIRTLPEAHVDLTKVASLPAETDGVVLPWLQWETSNDTSRSPSRAKMEVMEGNAACSESNHITSSRGSWSPEGNDCSFSRKKTESKLGEVGSPRSSSSLARIKGSSFHMDDYMHLKRSEDLLFERLRQRQRIDSGGLILCERMLM